jgi:Ser/Thr protein kinase RdoA (MazF antagonist)
MMAGYESVRTLSLAEWDSFPNELRFAALRFTVIRLNEFFASEREEAQRINEDFAVLRPLRVLRREKEGGMEGLLMAMATGYDYRKYQRVKAARKKGKAPRAALRPSTRAMSSATSTSTTRKTFEKRQRRQQRAPRRPRSGSRDS